ncbi:hypothetical protein T265_01089 [Opisthorchis viverrini]|uniref:Uncharacterized protein n=1 Tax=Opisthorchis viverrini TaxID=6198 RepID=A0A075AB09_OPIVI|nr:hypothetical protein T265_01089 [Opisthorchis viverrini]KER33005.1 hypothetical protein T265_01089 [Opisthorchis viverrini]
MLKRVYEAFLYVDLSSKNDRKQLEKEGTQRCKDVPMPPSAQLKRPPTPLISIGLHFFTFLRSSAVITILKGHKPEEQGHASPEESTRHLIMYGENRGQKRIK